MKMKIAKIMIFTIIMVALIALPNALGEKEKNQINQAITHPAPLPLSVNETVMGTNNFHSDLLIEKDIGKYRYVGSRSYDEIYGTRNVADYIRNENPAKNSYNSAEVIVFDNNTKAREYVITKLKTAVKAGYKIRQINGVIFFSNPQYKHFIWQHENYAIVVSAYEDVTPRELMSAYLEMYPAQFVQDVKDKTIVLNIEKISD